MATRSSYIEKLNFEKLPENEYYKAVEQTFKYFDEDRDGYLNKQEFTKIVGQVASKVQGYQITQELIDYVFKRVDNDKDGKLALKEFYSACHHYYFK